MAKKEKRTEKIKVHTLKGTNKSIYNMWPIPLPCCNTLFSTNDVAYKKKKHLTLLRPLLCWLSAPSGDVGDRSPLGDKHDFTVWYEDVSDIRFRVLESHVTREYMLYTCRVYYSVELVTLFAFSEAFCTLWPKWCYFLCGPSLKWRLRHQYFAHPHTIIKDVEVLLFFVVFLVSVLPLMKWNAT